MVLLSVYVPLRNVNIVKITLNTPMEGLMGHPEVGYTPGCGGWNFHGLPCVSILARLAGICPPWAH